MDPDIQLQSMTTTRARRNIVVVGAQALVSHAAARLVPEQDGGAPTEVERRSWEPRRHRSAYLTVLNGRHLSAVFELAMGDNIIGRSETAAVRLTDHGVSRLHAKAVRDEDGSVKLVDIDSTNGTFINSHRIHAEGLREGDKIRLGPTAILRFGYRHPAGNDSLDRPRSAASAAAAPRTRVGHDATIDVYLHTLRLREEKLGPNHPELVEVLDAVGSALLARKAYESAQLHFARAVRILEEDGVPAPGPLATTLSRLGRCELGRRDPIRALALLERAHSLACVHDGASEELPQTRFALARTLRRLGRSPQRRLDLARQARHAASSGGLANRELCEAISRWLSRELGG